MKTPRKSLQHFDVPGHAHELTFSCQGRRPLLAHEPTREYLAAAIRSARETHGFHLLAYVFMPEHVHLLILPQPGTVISEILKSIKQSSSRRAIAWLCEHDPELHRSLAVTRPSGKVEHRFWLQGGGYDRNIKSREAAWDVVNYIHQNPVRRGLVKTTTEWRWSSAVAYEDGRDVPLSIDRTLG